MSKSSLTSFRSFRTVLRDLLKYVYAGLWKYELIVWYFAKSESMASIDNVR